MQINCDFTDYLAAQDMIMLIMRDKNLSSASEAVESSITANGFKSILNAGWGDIAVSQWGHGDPERKWETLENPLVKTELDENKFDMLSKIVVFDERNIEDAASLFLVLTMVASVTLTAPRSARPHHLFSPSILSCSV